MMFKCIQSLESVSDNFVLRFNISGLHTNRPRTPDFLLDVFGVPTHISLNRSVSPGWTSSSHGLVWWLKPPGEGAPGEAGEARGEAREARGPGRPRGRRLGSCVLVWRNTPPSSHGSTPWKSLHMEPERISCFSSLFFWKI